MKEPRNEKTTVSPTVLTGILERAEVALARGETATARHLVQGALARLYTQRAAQNVVLDAITAAPEVRAVRETPPLHADEKDGPRR